MNLPKRLYPHLHEYERLIKEDRELDADNYVTENEKVIMWEYKMIYQVKLLRDKNCGTHDEIHKIMHEIWNKKN